MKGLIAAARAAADRDAGRLPGLAPAGVVRPLPYNRRRELELVHHREIVVSADRLGLPTGTHVRCACGWTGSPAVDWQQADRDSESHLEAVGDAEMTNARPVSLDRTGVTLFA